MIHHDFRMHRAGIFCGFLLVLVIAIGVLRDRAARAERDCAN